MRGERGWRVRTPQRELERAGQPLWPLPLALRNGPPITVGGLTSACILEIFTITGCLIEIPAGVFSGCPRRSARPGDSWWATPVRAPRKGRGRAHLGPGSGGRGPQPRASPLHCLLPAGHLGGGAPERGPLQAGGSGRASAAPSSAGTLLAGPLSLLLPILPPDGLENQSLAKFSPCPETRHNRAPPGPSGHTSWGTHPGMAIISSFRAAQNLWEGASDHHKFSGANNGNKN